MYSVRRRLSVLGLALPVVAAVTICCSASIATAASSQTAGSLSGKWSGKYGGAYRGTFTLQWKQTGSQLSGWIKLSTNRGAKVTLTGTVRGSTIRFGTVGSAAVTYSGVVSGKSMSGTYHTPGGSGSWSAHKT